MQNNGSLRASVAVKKCMKYFISNIAESRFVTIIQKTNKFGVELLRHKKAAGGKVFKNPPNYRRKVSPKVFWIKKNTLIHEYNLCLSSPCSGGTLFQRLSLFLPHY